MGDVYLVGRSHALAKVLTTNSTAAMFPFQQIPRTVEPGLLTDSAGFRDGCLEADVKNAGKGGPIAPAGLFLQPYCEGPAGTAFYLNVWGYSLLAGTAQQAVWVPFFIAQIWCQSGNIPGPALPLAPTTPLPLLSDNEYLCDSLAVTMGNAWPFVAGSGYAAWLQVGLCGAQKFLVEFAADPNYSGRPTDMVPGMNALWRPL